MTSEQINFPFIVSHFFFKKFKEFTLIVISVGVLLILSNHLSRVIIQVISPLKSFQDIISSFLEAYKAI